MSLSQPFIVRPAIQADLASIVAIYNQSIATKQSTADLYPVTMADRQAWFDTHTMKKNRPIVVAVDADNQILGWATLSDLFDRYAYRISSEISIYVSNSAKRKGVGAYLVKHMLWLAPQCGIQQVVAKIFGHNEPSLTLFRKLGFEDWGVLKRVCEMDGFIADVVLLGYSV